MTCVSISIAMDLSIELHEDWSRTYRLVGRVAFRPLIDSEQLSVEPANESWTVAVVTMFDGAK